jgi:hypothetical protein
MDPEALRRWLAEPHSELITAVAEGVRAHVATLKERSIGFYGYALLPGEPYDVHSLVAVTNSESDIKVPRTDKLYRYYRFSVDEWARWDHEGFTAANALLVQANQRFAAMHSKAGAGYSMDEFEVAHTEALLEAVVRGLEAAKSAGAFDDTETFLAVWISDSAHPIMCESVRRLNPAAVTSEFMAEFGSWAIGNSGIPGRVEK